MALGEANTSAGDLALEFEGQMNVPERQFELKVHRGMGANGGPIVRLTLLDSEMDVDGCRAVLARREAFGKCIGAAERQLRRQGSKLFR